MHKLKILLIFIQHQTLILMKNAIDSKTKKND